MLQAQLIGCWTGMAGGAWPVPLLLEFHQDGTYVATQLPHDRLPVATHGTYCWLSSQKIEVVAQPTVGRGTPPTVTEHLTCTIEDDQLTLIDQHGDVMRLQRLPP